MSNYTQMKELITAYSGQEKVIVIPTIYIEITEDLNTATLLNQLIFWSDKSKRKDGFFYKTYLEWEQEIYLSEYQVRRSAKKLKEMSILETKVKKANGSPTLHYKINMDKLSESILEKLKNGNLRNSSNETKETKESLTVDYDIKLQQYNKQLEKEPVKQVDDDVSVKEDKKESIPYKEIIEHLNEKTGTSLLFKTKGHQSLIKARWNEGYRLRDFKMVVDFKSADQYFKDNPQYLLPKTIFGNKFGDYLQTAKFDASKKGTKKEKEENRVTPEQLFELERLENEKEAERRYGSKQNQ